MTSSNQSYDRDSVSRVSRSSPVLDRAPSSSSSPRPRSRRGSIASRRAFVVARARRRARRRAHQRVVDRAVERAVAGAGEALEQGPEPFVRHVRNIRRRARAARSIAIRVREPRREVRERRANLVASVEPAR
jgi:hypothetical protein